MKKLIIILLLIISGYLHAQTNDRLIIKNGNIVMPSKDSLYILDGEVVNKSKIATLNAIDIAEISILNDEKSSALYGTLGARGAVLVSTKKYEIKTYQNKFSEYSPQYKKFLAEVNHEDGSILYVINGAEINSDNMKVSKLFAAAQKKIKRVHFIENGQGTYIDTIKVIITTK